MTNRKERRPSRNLLRNVKFIKLISVHDLPIAESLRKELRNGGVGAVILNDEKVQARPDKERENAEVPLEGFRIEVPEPMIEKARRILSDAEKRREE